MSFITIFKNKQPVFHLSKTWIIFLSLVWQLVRKKIQILVVVVIVVIVEVVVVVEVAVVTYCNCIIIIINLYRMRTTADKLR